MEWMGGSLVNIILGALILWVGQTTFHHAGFLAGVDERFDSVGLQFSAVDDRHESFRLRLEQVVADTTDRTRSRFTREDAAKISLYIREVDDQRADFERQMHDRLTEIQLKVIALETRGSHSQEVATLRAEVERLRLVIAQRAYGTLASYPNGLRGDAEHGPIHLPPTTQR